MRRCLQGVGRNEVVELQEVAAHFGSEEHDGRKNDQEAGHTHDVVHGIVGVERDAVDGVTLCVFGAVLDFYAVRVVGADFVQSYDVSDHQTDQYQRHGDDVQREEAVQGGVGHHVVTTNPDGELWADKGNSG